MRKLLTFLTFCIALSAHAITAGEIAAQLDGKKAVSGNFTQTRHLRGIEKPVEAAGHYDLRQGELLWNLETPFPVKLKITEAGIFQEQNGAWQPAQNNNTSRQTKMFLGLLSGNWKPLEDYFNVDAAGEPSDWTITLKPKAGPLQQIFTDIVLKGTAQSVTHITIREAQGDTSELALSPNP